MEVSMSLIIAVLAALVGLLCLGLAVTAMLRRGKILNGQDLPGETPADLKIFAFRQSRSALIMFALTGIIIAFS